MDTNPSQSPIHDIRPPMPKAPPYRSRMPAVIISLIMLALVGYIVYALFVRKEKVEQPSVENPLSVEGKLRILEDLESVGPSNGAVPLTEEERAAELGKLNTGKAKRTGTEEERLKILQQIQ